MHCTHTIHMITSHRLQKVEFSIEWNVTEIHILLGIMLFVRNRNCLLCIPTKSIIPNNMGISVTMPVLGACETFLSVQV